MTRRVTETVPDDDPPIDPDAVRQAYWDHRAARLARVHRRKRVKRAGIRFWLTLVALVGGGIGLAIVMWREVQQLFGL